MAANWGVLEVEVEVEEDEEGVDNADVVYNWDVGNKGDGGGR